ncbi:MAG TPA: hypothetical protein VGO45_13395, partial [Bacteroidia bacterium]|nr:hypothetical protein [Bacteroidia bacterium]
MKKSVNCFSLVRYKPRQAVRVLSLLIILLGFLVQTSIAQTTLHAKQAYIHINAGTKLVAGGDIDLEASSQFDNSGQLTAKGNWTNNSGAGGFVTATNGTTEFSGTTTQAIAGSSPSTFNQLNLLGTGQKTIISDYPVTVNGNLTITDGAVNTLLNNTITGVSPLLVKGNLVLSSGSTLQSNGPGFELRGNLQVDGTMNYGSSGNRNLLFSSSTAQSISGAGTLSVYAMQVSKTAGTLTLSKAIGIDNTLTLTAGNIISTSTNLLTFNNGSTVTGASNTSYVSGPVKKVGNSAFTFPLGSSSQSSNGYHPAAITAPVNTTDAFTAQYFRAGQSDGSNADVTLVNLSNCEYWNVTEPAGTSLVSLSLGWNPSSCDTTTPANMRVAYWNGTSSTWKDQGGINPTGTSATGTITSSAALSAWGDFTLANKANIPST